MKKGYIHFAFWQVPEDMPLDEFNRFVTMVINQTFPGSDAKVQETEEEQERWLMVYAIEPAKSELFNELERLTQTVIVQMKKQLEIKAKYPEYRIKTHHLYRGELRYDNVGSDVFCVKEHHNFADSDEKRQFREIGVEKFISLAQPK